MRRNKTKLVIAILAAALALNSFAIVPYAEEDLEMVLDFKDAPDQLAVSEELGDVGLEATEDEVGQTVAPGKYISYNGRVFKVSENAVSFVTDGTFDTDPGITDDSNSSRTESFNFSSSSPTYVTTEGHDALGSVRIDPGNILIWRRSFESNKLYVYSAWFKLTGDAVFDDNQRHLAGAIDIATGSSHNNELGRTVTKTGGWQQDMCVFNGAGTGEDRLAYLTNVGSNDPIYIDDFVIYEVEEVEAIEVTGHSMEDDDWNEYDEIPAPGEYSHIIRYENNFTSVVALRGVVALFKDGKLVKIYTKDVNSRVGALADGNLSPGRGTVEIRFTVPEGEDVSAYSYVAYLCSPSNPFYIYGKASSTNAAVVYGKQ